MRKICSGGSHWLNNAQSNVILDPLATKRFQKNFPGSSSTQVKLQTLKRCNATVNGPLHAVMGTYISTLFAGEAREKERWWRFNHCKCLAGKLLMWFEEKFVSLLRFPNAMRLLNHTTSFDWLHFIAIQCKSTLPCFSFAIFFSLTQIWIRC